MAWFDATTVDPAGGSSQLPVGRHLLSVISSARTATKDNSGGMLVLTLRVMEGQFAGATGLYRLNLWNASTKAAEIAGKQLSALCHVTGVYKLEREGNGQDCMEFFGVPFYALIEPQPENPNYTQVTAVFDRNGNPPGKSGQPAPAPAQSAPAQSAPAQSAPAQAQPTWGQSAPAQAQPTWGQSAPAQSAPAQSAPAQAQPTWGQSAPAQSAPAQSAPAQAQPTWAQSAPGASPPWAR